MGGASGARAAILLVSTLKNTKLSAVPAENHITVSSLQNRGAPPRQAFDYDPNGPLERNAPDNAVGAVTLESRVFYDAAGNVTSVTESTGSGDPRSETTYTYDCF